MPVSKKRKKPVKKKPGKKTFKPYEVVKQKMWEMPNVFPKEMEFAERHRLLVDAGEKAVLDFEGHYKQLQGLFKEYDPLYLCSFSALYFLGHREGIDKEAIDGQMEFHSFFVETMQALILFGSRKEYTVPLGARAHELHDLLRDLNTTQSGRYLAMLKNVKTQEDMDPLILRTEMMGHTLAVRNWAYEPQMIKVTKELVALVSERFEKRCGYNLVALFEILMGLVEHATEKMNAYLRKMREVLALKDYRAMFRKYSDTFGVDMGSEKDQDAVWESSRRNLKNFRGHLIAHSDFFLSELNTFTIEDMLGLTQMEFDADKLRDVIDGLSYGFGELADWDKDHVFLGNPVHNKPFIKLEDGRYYSVIVYLFYHLGVDLLENLLRQEQQLFNYYVQEKGKYLERKLEDMLHAAFPNGKLYSGSQWKCENSSKIFENDLVLVIEQFAVVVEAKSGMVTPPARRGAPGRLFETLKELVVEPSVQAMRFVDFLKANPGINRFSTKAGKVNEVDTTKVKYFIPLGVTLSSLGAIGSNLKKLIDSKITDRTLDELAPSISLCDLEIIFDILELQSEKIHYLIRRREFDAHARFHGDELDLFGFYLDNGFNIGEAEFDHNFYLDLILKSKELDPYVLGTAKGIKIKKPFLAKTKFWADILGKLDGKGVSWLEASYILLNAPAEDQLKFEKKFELLKELIRKGKMDKDHNWVSFLSGPERRRHKIIGYPYQNLTREERHEMVNEIIHRELTEDIRGIVIIGCDLQAPAYPYNFIAGTDKTNFLDEL